MRANSRLVDDRVALVLAERSEWTLDQRACASLMWDARAR